jgi:SET domain-containing protein
MFDIYIDKRAEVKKSPLPNGEWGVFANDFIPKGTVIEIARALKLKNSHLFQEGNILNDYVFKLDDEHSMIAFGFGSLFNHSDDPLIEYKVEKDRVIYSSIKDIYPGQEIFISYGTDWWKDRGIKPEVKGEVKGEVEMAAKPVAKVEVKSLDGGDYYEKYLKYKEKYAQLKAAKNFL